MRASFIRRVAILAVAADIAAAFAIAVAMALYPGGTGASLHQVGHSFWQNVLCDLAQPTAFNGESNAAARPFAQLGTMAIFLAGALINLLAPSVIEEPHCAKRARWFGVAASCVAVFLPLFPSEHHPFVHSLIVLLAGPLALLGLVYWVSGILREDSAAPLLRWITISFALTASTAFFAWTGWFLRMFIERHPDSDTAFPAQWVPPLQRLALLCLVAWIPAVARGSQARFKVR